MIVETPRKKLPASLSPRELPSAVESRSRHFLGFLLL